MADFNLQDIGNGMLNVNGIPFDNTKLTWGYFPEYNTFSLRYSDGALTAYSLATFTKITDAYDQVSLNHFTTVAGLKAYVASLSQAGGGSGLPFTPVEVVSDNFTFNIPRGRVLHSILFETNNVPVNVSVGINVGGGELVSFQPITSASIFTMILNYAGDMANDTPIYVSFDAVIDVTYRIVLL